MIDARLDGTREAREFLSPYLIPLPMKGELPEIESLLSAGHVTVVRLRLDGGISGIRDEAIRSVKEQLLELKGPVNRLSKSPQKARH